MPSPKSSLAERRRQGVAGRPGGDPRNNSGEVPAGHPRRLPRMAALLLAARACVGVAGCGGGDASGRDGERLRGRAAVRGGEGGAGVAWGDAPATSRSRLVAWRRANEAGGGVDLATDGSNSRRATEDTSAVATLEAPGPGNKFSPRDPRIRRHPPGHLIVRREGMKRIIEAVEGAGSSATSANRSTKPSNHLAPVSPGSLARRSRPPGATRRGRASAPSISGYLNA